MTLPAFVDALRVALESSESRFRWIEPTERADFTEMLASGFEQNPFADDFQQEGTARIQRSIPLFSGPTRPVRLTQISRSCTLLFDPEMPDKLVLALGPNLPPQLWPEAEPTPEGLTRDLEVYLDRPFRSAHRMTRCVRVARGALEELGIDGIETFARIVGNSESWTDGAALWNSGVSDDPWPEETSTASMISLRVTQHRAAEEHPDRRRSISMRTLWSRSVLTIEQGPFEHIVFELRYDPAPRIAKWPIAESGVPDGIPVDLLASMLRGGVVMKGELDELKKGRITPYIGLLACLLEPSETTTFELLRGMLRDPELLDPALALTSSIGARALLYELECETSDESLRARLSQINTLQPATDASERDEDEDEDDWDDGEDDEDDEDDEEETP